MKKLETIVEEILVELIATRDQRVSPKDEDGNLQLLQQIGDSAGGSFHFSRYADQRRNQLARHLMQSDPALKARYAENEWGKLVNRAFTNAVNTLNMNDNLACNAQAILGFVKSQLQQNQAPIEGREHAVGCTLFGNTEIEAFNIGQVRFENRLDWLDRNTSTGLISSISSRRISRTWSGEKLRKRKSSFDYWLEKDILRTIGNCPFVCSVITNDLAPEAAKTKALVAARLCLTSIALLWETPSKALNGFNLLFDDTAKNQELISYSGAKFLSSGGSLSHLPHGGWFETGEWETTLIENSNLFSVTAELLNLVLSPSETSKRPEVVGRLHQALQMFHEGCKSILPVMATMHFGACLDILAKGKGDAQIEKLITAHIGHKKKDQLFTDGITMQQFVSEAYKKGRSRTIHGSNMELGHDWSSRRERAEKIARICIISCINWAAKNPESDDTISMMQDR